jgi:hypothetical protein
MPNANYPSNSLTFGSDRVDLVSSVLAEDVNSLYREVVAISTDLGAGAMGVGTPGLRYSAAWNSGGTFDTTTTTWTGLQTRIQNIEKGVYQAFTNRVSTAGGSSITSSAVGVVGLNFSLISSQTANPIQITNSAGNAQVFSIAPSGNITTSGGITTSGALVVGGNASVTGTLAITGNATFSGQLTAKVINGGTP